MTIPIRDLSVLPYGALPLVGTLGWKSHHSRHLRWVDCYWISVRACYQGIAAKVWSTESRNKSSKWTRMSILGLKILADSQNTPSGEKIPLEVLKMIAAHHERADGSGYPQGLENDEISVVRPNCRHRRQL